MFRGLASRLRRTQVNSDVVVHSFEPNSRVFYFRCPNHNLESRPEFHNCKFKMDCWNRGSFSRESKMEFRNSCSSGPSQQLPRTFFNLGFVRITYCKAESNNKCCKINFSMDFSSACSNKVDFNKALFLAVASRKAEFNKLAFRSGISNKAQCLEQA